MLRNFIMSFVGAILDSGIIIILLNNIFKSREKIMDNENDIRIHKSSTTEFDKIIKNFIEKSRKSLDYTKDKNLQKLCIDLYSLREILSVDRKNKVAFDFINTLNEVERRTFYKLTSKFKEEIDEYRDNCLKNDFEKIKKNRKGKINE